MTLHLVPNLFSFCLFFHLFTPSQPTLQQLLSTVLNAHTLVEGAE